MVTVTNLLTIASLLTVTTATGLLIVAGLLTIVTVTGLFAVTLFFVRQSFHSLQAGVTDEQSHEAAKAILLEMGEFFQIQVSLRMTCSRIHVQ